MSRSQWATAPRDVGPTSRQGVQTLHQMTHEKGISLPHPAFYNHHHGRKRHTHRKVKLPQLRERRPWHITWRTGATPALCRWKQILVVCTSELNIWSEGEQSQNEYCLIVAISIISWPCGKKESKCVYSAKTLTNCRGQNTENIPAQTLLWAWKTRETICNGTSEMRSNIL